MTEPPAQVDDLEIRSTAIDGLVRISAKTVADGRGAIRELYRESAFVARGLAPLGPVQVNLTESRQGVVRGIHAEQTTKLVSVASGEAFGAWVDLRPESPTTGALHTDTLVPGVGYLVPAGVGNGFQAVAPGVTQYLYLFDAEWRPDMPGTSVSALDADVAVPWPLPVDADDRTQISSKDALPR